MQTSNKAYFSGALGVLTSRVTSIVAGVLSLWFLTSILNTEQFAGYSVAMSVVILLGYSVGLGIERSMLLRIGALATEDGTLAGYGMMRRIMVITALLAGVVAVIVALYIGGSGTTPRHQFIQLMAPVIPAIALSLVIITWYQSNHRVGVSQVMLGLNDGTRSLVFGVCFLLGLGATGVAAGATLGALAPLLFLTLRTLRHNRVQEPANLGLTDIVSGVQFLLMRLSKMGLHNLDIIALGALGSTTGTAQYAVAARFAVLVESGQTIFAPTFTPRVRRHLSTNDHAAAAREYQVARVIGFAASLTLSIGFAVLGEPLLQIFGSFGVGFDAFMILVAANLITVGFGMHSAFLSMTDHIGLSTVNRLVSIGIFALCLWLLVPRLDDLGAALAFLTAVAVHDIAGIVILKRRMKIDAFDLVDGFTVFVAVILFCAIGLEFIPRLGGALALSALLAFTAVRHRSIMLGIAQNLLGMATRRT